MLVVTAVMLVALIGLAALAIDVGSFYQAQRQAQAAADAGALAGADALAGGASAASATTSATSLASTNYPSATVPTATVNGSTVTVNVANTTPAYFGQIFGITKENVGARAVAAGTQAASTPCPSGVSGGNTCNAVFAMDSNCSNNGVSFSAGSISVTGGVHSNGSIGLASSDSLGPTSFGPGASCKVTQGGGGNSFSSGPTQGPVIASYPIDYRLTYPKCAASGPIYCTGQGGTPSYCSYGAASYSFSSSGTNTGIYCAYGTGSPSDPSTYTGSVAVGGGGESITASYICGNFSIGGGGITLTPFNSPPGNLMLVYAAQTSSSAITLGGGGNSLNGHFFAPTGTITINAGSTKALFLEGQDVVLGAGGYSITGDGPVTASGGSGTGSASLTQ